MARAEYLVGVQTQNEDFVYDKLGNRTTLKHNGTDVARYQHNDVNEYTYIGLGSGTNVTHDDAGNMTTDHNNYNYTYDYENRLVEIENGSDVAKYTYDALGRRIEKIEYASPSNITTRYYYDGWRVLTEIEDDGQDTTQRDFAYGNYLDEALIMTVDDDDYYYAHDHLFSPVAMVDSSGDIQEYYQYDAYGKCTIYTAGTDDIWYNSDDAPQTTSTVGNPIFFTGQRLDELDTGSLLIMYYKNRYYLIALGRFTTRDPFGVRDGIYVIEFIPTGSPVFARKFNPKAQYWFGMNIYEAFVSSPIITRDPYGLKNESQECHYCGPEITGFLVNLINSAIDWRKSLGRITIQQGEDWLRENGGNLDWWSSAGKYKTSNCPSGPECKNTYWLCGECIHDHWIGNFMYAFLGRLLHQSDFKMNCAAEWVQRQANDPPWDKACYEIARNAFDELRDPKGKRDVCEIVKSNNILWDQANDTNVSPKRRMVGYMPFGPIYRTPKYPRTHASGYKNCKKCPEGLPKELESEVPGGKFGTKWPTMKE